MVLSQSGGREEGGKKWGELGRRVGIGRTFPGVSSERGGGGGAKGDIFALFLRQWVAISIPDGSGEGRAGSPTQKVGRQAATMTPFPPCKKVAADYLRRVSHSIP